MSCEPADWGIIGFRLLSCVFAHQIPISVAIEVVDEFPAGGVSLLLFIGQRLENDPVHFRVQGGVQLGRSSPKQLILQADLQFQQIRCRAVRREREVRCEHFEEHDPDGVDVGSGIDRSAQYLLRRHVERSPHDLGRIDAGAAQEPRDPEVRDDRSVRVGFDQYVGRLDVPVDDVLSVGVVQGIEDA